MSEQVSRSNTWNQVQLREVAAEYLSGGTPATDEPHFWDGNIAWTTSAPIADEAVELDRGQRNISQQGLAGSATHLVPAGNLLVGTRVGVGKAVVNLIDIAVSQDLTGVVLDSEVVDALFLAYQFKTARVRAFFDGRKRGTTIQGVSRFDLERLPVGLPPLPEQRAIARVLRSVQAAREARQREVALERERKAALMEHLFTHGTRGEPTKMTEIGEMPASWEVVRLGQVITDGPQNGVYKQASLYGQGTSILRIDDFDNEGRLTVTGLSKVRLSSEEVDRYHLTEGDIVVNRVNSLSHLGKCALIPKLEDEAVFESNMMRFRVDDAQAKPDYVFRWLTTESNRDRIRGMARRAVAQSSINQGDVGFLPLPLPDLREQQQMTEALSASDSKIATLEREMVLLDELFRALLEELMTGRLSVAGLT